MMIKMLILTTTYYRFLLSPEPAAYPIFQGGTAIWIMALRLKKVKWGEGKRLEYYKTTGRKKDTCVWLSPLPPFFEYNPIKSSCTSFSWLSNNGKNVLLLLLNSKGGQLSSKGKRGGKEDRAHVKWNRKKKKLCVCDVAFVLYISLSLTYLGQIGRW